MHRGIDNRECCVCRVLCKVLLAFKDTQFKVRIFFRRNRLNQIQQLYLSQKIPGALVRVN